jgi:hypothetical protein
MDKLPNHEKDFVLIGFVKLTESKSDHNNTYPKVGVQWAVVHFGDALRRTKVFAYIAEATAQRLDPLWVMQWTNEIPNRRHLY